MFGALKGAVKLHSCSLDVFAEQNGGRRVSRTWVWCQGEMGADGRKMGLCSYIDCYVLWVCYGHAIGVNWCAMGMLWVYCGYCLGSSGTEKSHLSEIRPCSGWICPPPLQPAQETFRFPSISLRLLLPWEEQWKDMLAMSKCGTAVLFPFQVNCLSPEGEEAGGHPGRSRS